MGLLQVQMLAQMASFSPRSCTWQHLWSSSLSILEPPGPREVHFWCLFPNELHQSSLLKLYEGILSREEQNQMLQVKIEKLRKEYLLTRILARTLLSRYAGGLVEPSSLKFERNKFGKPEVVWPLHTLTGETWHPPQLRFNLSHTHSLIACGITSGSRVGIDVEERGRTLNRDVLDFAQHKFSQVEAVWLEQFADFEERRHHFMQLWTLKEAYVKALGKGISGTTLKDFAFHLRASPAVRILLEKATGVPAHEQASFISLKVLSSIALYPDSWQFLLFQPTDFHYASICMEKIGSSDQGHGNTNDFRVQLLKTIPFIKDEPLCKSLGLGLTT